MLVWDLAHFDSSDPPGMGMLGLAWVPSTQALPAQAEDVDKSDMVGFESLGSRGAGAAGWSLYNAMHSIQPMHRGCDNPDTTKEVQNQT